MVKTNDIAGMTGGSCVPTPAPQLATGLPMPYATRVPGLSLATTGVDRLFRERAAGFGSDLVGSTGPGAHPV